MATYAVGDLQGCYDELRALLDRLRFDPAADRLWFTGDLVNRGPKSAQCLRFVKSLGSRAVTVLGNHDLHLAAAALTGEVRKRDTVTDILRAPDRDELLAWLRRQPLAHYEAGPGLLIHAGLLPQWDLAQVLALAQEATALIASPQGDEFLRSRMYGDEPSQWREDLRGWDRLRLIVNVFTRLRYCTRDGRVRLDYKGPPGGQPPEQVPWFALPQRRTRDLPIYFGHWSMLGQVRWPEHRVFGLDTGCVWGGRLSAIRLEDGAGFSVPSKGYSTAE